MTKRILMGFMAFSFVALAIGPAAAQEEEPAPIFTQGQLAQLLVKQLGLAPFLPPLPTDQECIAILLANGITPTAEGWSAGAEVNRGMLARCVVQALKQEDTVQDPSNPQSWIDALAELGISFDTVGQAVSQAQPKDQPLTREVYRTTSDPLLKRDISTSDTIVTLFFAQQVIAQMPAPTPQPRPDVTPN